MECYCDFEAKYVYEVCFTCSVSYDDVPDRLASLEFPLRRFPKKFILVHFCFVGGVAISSTSTTVTTSLTLAMTSTRTRRLQCDRHVRYPDIFLKK